jgi:hypothetical protein
MGNLRSFPACKSTHFLLKLNLGVWCLGDVIFFVCEEITIAQIAKSSWGISSAGRALHWQCRGKRFEPAMLHRWKPLQMQGFLILVEERLKWKMGGLQTNCKHWIWKEYRAQVGILKALLFVACAYQTKKYPLLYS